VEGEVFLFLFDELHRLFQKQSAERKRNDMNNIDVMKPMFPGGEKLK
jgi:hypothetical protein